MTETYSGTSTRSILSAQGNGNCCEVPKNLPAQKDPQSPTAVVPEKSESKNAKPWEGLLHNTAEAVEAQISIWKLQLALSLLRAAAGFVAGVILIALGIYGFVLLDRSIDIAISQHADAWVSPLARGFVYFMIAASVLFPAIKSAFVTKDESGHWVDKGEGSHAA